MKIRTSLRLFWNRLWIRKDEFHKSLDMDFDALLEMDYKQQRIYIKELSDRRQIAHKRDMKQYDEMEKDK